MGFPTPNYPGAATAPGLIVIAVDYRLVRAFPVLDDESPLDQMYRRSAERILLQSVAAFRMCFGPPLNPFHQAMKEVGGSDS